jgi:hypothetical protein
MIFSHFYWLHWVVLAHSFILSIFHPGDLNPRSVVVFRGL